MNYAQSERLAAFNLLSRDEIVLILSVDHSFMLPARCDHFLERMGEAKRFIERGDDVRPLTDKRIRPRREAA